MRWFAASTLLLASLLSRGDDGTTGKVIDLTTRPGIQQRFLYLPAPHAFAVAILFTGGPGVLAIDSTGELGKGRGISVALADAPSDRQAPPFLAGFRETPAHLADVRAMIRWLRHDSTLPVWLIGTSRGTQSAAYVATTLAGDDDTPDGLVLTSSILVDPNSPPVTALNLDRLTLPVLVIHHANDGCRACPPSALPALMTKLAHSRRTALITLEGGLDEGNPCDAQAHHGFNGIEDDAVSRIADWIRATSE
jgi:hypothetical protein